MQEMSRADREEAMLMQCYDLPQDPFYDREDNQLNFPLLAFTYLLRRFVVSVSNAESLVCY